MSLNKLNVLNKENKTYSDVAEDFLFPSVTLQAWVSCGSETGNCCSGVLVSCTYAIDSGGNGCNTDVSVTLVSMAATLLSGSTLCSADANAFCMADLQALWALGLPTCACNAFTCSSRLCFFVCNMLIFWSCAFDSVSSFWILTSCSLIFYSHTVSDWLHFLSSLCNFAISPQMNFSDCCTIFETHSKSSTTLMLVCNCKRKKGQIILPKLSYKVWSKR